MRLALTDAIVPQIRDVYSPQLAGTGPAMTDLLDGQVDMLFAELPAAGPYIKDGKLRAIPSAA